MIRMHDYFSLAVHVRQAAFGSELVRPQHAGTWPKSLSALLERRATVGRFGLGHSHGSHDPAVPVALGSKLPRGHCSPSPFLDWVAVHPLIMLFVIFELPFSCRSIVLDFSLALKDGFRRRRRV